ncbi:hypothetical protein [Spiroplasma endosymbiont of Agriotes lineatus]|uniref:hypothetical protein n=1 Tax=Spiroplasma endosymbiont of Agriotes lineatus TaxID=3077930 RepID=UPI0030CDF384
MIRRLQKRSNSFSWISHSNQRKRIGRIWENTLNEIKSREKMSRDTKYLFKSYTKKIPAQRAEIVKLKAELESSKAKETQKQQQMQHDLSLENENLKLKQKILEIELKLKEANRER